MSREEKQAWDRQPGESSKSYAAFSTYLDLGPNRSIVKAIKSSGRSPGNLRQWELWSSQYQWVNRAAAYDDQSERTRLARMETERREMNDRQAKIGLMGQNVALRAIEKLLTHIESGEKPLCASDAARLLDVSAKLERLARGASTDIRHVSGPDARFIQIDQEKYILAVRRALGFTDAPVKTVVIRSAALLAQPRSEDQL
jgi:hypothetical protein